MVRCSLTRDLSVTLLLFLLSIYTARGQGNLNDAAARELPAPALSWFVLECIVGWSYR
jgi:hypothetical protein